MQEVFLFIFFIQHLLIIDENKKALLKGFFIKNDVKK